MKTDVLVVGGGPVGLSMACELYRHGVSCRVVDQNDAPQIWSKAAAMSARTLEMLDDMGLVGRMHERGRPVYGMNLHNGKECLARVEFEMAGTSYPYILGISQRDTELLLAEHLEALGGQLERPLKLESFEHDDSGVTATLVHPDGRHEHVEAGWLIGCDGAKSTVRHVLGLPFEGSTFEQNLIMADIRVDLPFAIDPHEGVLFVSSAGLIVLLPLLGENRYRAICPNMPDPDAEPTIGCFEAIANERAPSGTRFHDEAWVTKFRFHGRIVPRYRTGRVFLAGDAAHIHSPVGGQGMNMGMQDAYNLAWKLALVQQGAARPWILDSYEPERRPVAAATVGVTDRVTQAMMRAMTLRSPIAEALRNQVMAFVASSGLVGERLFSAVGQLDVSYGSSPLVGEHHVSIWSSEVGGARETEQPKLSDWIGFSRGIGAGERVPNLDLAGGSKLSDLLRGTQHVLFLFDGEASTPEGYENLGSIARTVEERWGRWIRVHIVVPEGRNPDLEILRDADLLLHRHFGCRSEGLCLVRPDGYVGFRSQPAAADKLYAYLERIWI